MKYVIVVIIIAISQFTVTACAQHKIDSNNTDAYEYPIKAGTEKWKALSSHNEMVAVCQIPENILKDISTAGLIETVLNYPLRMDFNAYNSPQEGIKAQIRQFNGLSELLNRGDAGKELLDRYQRISPLKADELGTDFQKGDFGYELSYLELILSYDSILSSFTENEQVDLLREVSRKYTEKQQSAVFSASNKNKTVWLMGKVLLHTDFPPFVGRIQQDENLQNFLEDGFYADSAVIKEIESFVNQFLSKR